MMILSRIWYVITAILLAAAYYVVALAVGQYNRRNEAAMEETLKADSQVVSWAMQVDARRRLDVLLLAAVDPGIAKAIKGANNKENIPPGARDEGSKALRAFNEKLPPDYKNDVLFIADREGRLVSQVGYDAVNGFAEFELGGYPAVFDALHGFLRDDTWVWGGKLARVVARPVEDEVGQPPLGAVIALRWIDTTFTKELAKRTRTNVAFFALSQRVASAATTDGLDDSALEALGSDLKGVTEDKGFKENGRTDVRPLGDDKGGVLYVRVPGEAWELGGGFAVARPKVAIHSPTGFLSGADDTDKKNVKLWLVGALFFGAAAIGFFFLFLEHSRPLREMKQQALKLKGGQFDTLQLPRFNGAYRAIAADINDGIQRIVEKGGGTARKPADLQAILGPVPAQPSMSAFSFPLTEGSAITTVPNVPPGPPSGPASVPNPPASNAGPRVGPPPPVNPRPTPPGTPNAAFAAPGPRLAPPPPPNSGPLGPPPGPALASGINAWGGEDEETRVGQPPAEVIQAATGEHHAADETAEWPGVYEEFIKTKRECGEPTDGLTFEKFKQTLKKNRDALIARHGCKRVKFSVYVKDGRASLKATPVRD